MEAAVPVYPGDVGADVLVSAVVPQHQTKLGEDREGDEERPRVGVICQVPQGSCQLGQKKEKQHFYQGQRLCLGQQCMPVFVIVPAHTGLHRTGRAETIQRTHKSFYHEREAVISNVRQQWKFWKVLLCLFPSSNSIMSCDRYQMKHWLDFCG